MSVTSSEVVVTALLEALDQPGLEDRRFHARGIHGLPPETLLATLADRFDAEAPVIPDGGETVLLKGVNLRNGATLIPYMVGALGRNSGGGGFAATLRTRFREGAPSPRTLLILDPAPVETVLTASEDVMELPQLSWRAIAGLAAREVASDMGVAEHPHATDILLDAWSVHSDPSPEALSQLVSWLQSTISDPPVQAGRALPDLGCFLPDSSAFADRDRKDWDDSARLRRDLERWRSAATPFAIEVRRRLGSKLPPEVVERVIGASRPFGIDWSELELRDFLQGVRRLDPLRLHRTAPVEGGRAVRFAPPTLVLWLGTDATDTTLKLSRASRADEELKATLADTVPDVTLRPGSAEAILRFPEAEEGTWSFGRLEVTVGSGARQRVSDTIRVAIHRSDRDWFPVDSAMDIDPAQGGFRCEDDPDPIAIGDGGRSLGAAVPEDLPENAEEESVELTVRFRGEERVLPVVLLGRGGDADLPEPPDEDDPEDDDPEGEPGYDDGRPPADRHLSLPHAMIALGSAEWPQPEDQAALEFLVGQRLVRLDMPPVAGTDLVSLEQAILEHPTWFSFGWDPGSTRLQRRPGEPETQFLPERWSAFCDARASFFAAARAVGSAYALDPLSDVARGYVKAYQDVLDQIDWDGRYRREWDLFLLLDSVSVGGVPGVLIAPTHPLAVAYHAQLARRFRTWLAQDDVPLAADLSTLRIDGAVPLLHVDGQWHESAPCDAALWRRYVPFSREAPGTPERNERFIAARLEFFLDVHPVYRRQEQHLAVAFHHPPSSSTVLGALKAFYGGEVNNAAYQLPRCDVTVIGGPPDIERQLLAGLAASGETEIARERTRLMASRITIHCQDEEQEAPFAHLSFAFRSPGRRQVQPVDMADRSETVYLSGLAATAGRKLYDDADRTFVWGTWSKEPDREDELATLVHRNLSLVHGQPSEKLEPGWTRMASTVVSSEELARLYKRSAWVVHLDRLLGIETFAGDERGLRQLIDYEERADPRDHGFDGITATEQVEPYLGVISRAIGTTQTPTDDGLRSVLRRLNAVSGRWAIQMLHRPRAEVLERIGFVTAIAALEDLDHAVGRNPTGTAVLVPLDELLSRKSHRGVARAVLPVPVPEGPMGDDLLLLWVPADAPADEPLRIGGVVIEVKYADATSLDTDVAMGQIARTRDWLGEVFNTKGASRPFRARDLADLLRTSAARAATFGVGAPVSREFETTLGRVVAGDYELDLRHWRGGERTGMIVSVEPGLSASAAQTSVRSRDGDVDLVRLGAPALAALVSGEALHGPVGTRWAPLDLDPPARPASTSADAEEDRSKPGDAPPPPVAFDPEELAALCQRMDGALQKYKLPCEPCRIDLAQVGPNIVRLRTQPLGALSISAIEAKARDLGREVDSPGAVIVTQEPGFVCIDVPRPNRAPVPYAATAATITPSVAPGALEFIVGVAPSGEVHTADLARLPHLLVAGSTGSGKSVFLRGLLCGLLRSRGPETLRILLVDPKQLDFAGFRSLPHLEGGNIITDASDAIATLRATIARERERRLPILADAGVSSAVEYYEQGGSYEALPQMVVLVDEFADLAGSLTGSSRKEFLDVVQGYAQVTRAYGIYLVLATQRPSVDVITGPIKANLPARIAMSLPSNVDSRTVLDRVGAEDLLGNGDMLFYSNGHVERLQGLYTTGDDVQRAVDRWR